MTKFKREDVESPSQLLARWRIMRNVYERMMVVDYGEDSPARNQMIATMDNQLRICIEDLEKIIEDPIVAALSESIRKTNDK